MHHGSPTALLDSSTNPHGNLPFSLRRFRLFTSAASTEKATALERFGTMVKVTLVALVAAGAGTAVFAPSPAAAGVAAPQPLRGCQIPAGAVTVRTADELKNELASKKAHDIAIAPGDYAPSKALKTAAPHRIWGSHANAVTIRAGITFAGPGAPGFEVHCITFDVSQSNKADKRSGTSIIYSVRKWSDITIADSRLLGNMKIQRGIFALVPQGLTVERTEVRDFMRDGIKIKQGSGRATLRDLVISNIERPGSATYGGKGEAGLGIDSAVTIERVRIRDAYWMGIAVNDHDVTVRDLDVDGSLHAIYLEHYSHRFTLSDFHFGRGNQRGVTIEWDNPKKYGGKPTAVDTLIQDGVIESYRIGAAIMHGQVNTTIRRVTFRNQCGAAIIAHQPRSTGGVYVDNDVSGIKPGAYEMTTKHPNTMKCR